MREGNIKKYSVYSGFRVPGPGFRVTGFTLIEIVVVIAIMAIIAVVVLPAVSVSQRNLDSAAKTLRSDLQLAQDFAMTSGGTYGFRMINSTSYEIYAGAPGNPAYNPLTNTSFVVDISPVQISGAVSDIPFAASGAPSIAGDATIAVAGGGGSRTITISQGTGVVTLGP